MALFAFGFACILIGLLALLLAYWALNKEIAIFAVPCLVIGVAMSLLGRVTSCHTNFAKIRPSEIKFAVIGEGEDRYVEMYHSGVRADITRQEHVNIFQNEKGRMNFYLEYSTKELKDTVIPLKLRYEIVEKAVEKKKD